MNLYPELRSRIPAPPGRVAPHLRPPAPSRSLLQIFPCSCNASAFGSPDLSTCRRRSHLNPFLSSSYALFSTTDAPQLLWNQIVPHSFYRNGGVEVSPARILKYNLNFLSPSPCFDSWTSVAPCLRGESLPARFLTPLQCAVPKNAPITEHPTRMRVLSGVPESSARSRRISTHIRLSPLQYAVPKNAPITPLECAVTKKGRGRG
jgi:hypothetical protein